jgi:alpha-glucosidase
VADWWQTGIIYQVYPRSFMDSNGDGVGDLPGITAKLDYLAWLGVDALWLSPIFRSPMADFGYDVADYEDIDPLFGTLDDFSQLLDAAHARGLRVILDLVPNHTSNQHPWFLESRASRDNPKRDWYIWRDAKPDGSPPNNWLAYFGGAAWTWDAATGQYYLHNFLPEQPDLNYRNPEVQQAMFGIIRRWLARGIDGFRIDVIDRMIKHADLLDNPPEPTWKPGDNPTWRYQRVHSEGSEGIHELIRQFRAVFDEFEQRVMVGEIQYLLDPAQIVPFYGAPNPQGDGGDEIHLPFNFALLMLPWNAERIRAFVDSYDAAVPPYGWPNYVTGNHDRGRIATSLGAAQARVAALMILTLRGTPTLYQGEELGLIDGVIPPDRLQDPQGINIPGTSRDPERTPMQWSAAPYAGFSTVEPWLPVNPDYPTLNVETAQADPRSMLTFYRQLIALRREAPALHLGGYHSLDAPEGVFAYERAHEGARYVVALNFTAVAQTVSLAGRGQVRLSTHLDRAGETVDLEQLALRADEGVVIGLA